MRNWNSTGLFFLIQTGDDVWGCLGRYLKPHLRDLEALSAAVPSLAGENESSSGPTGALSAGGAHSSSGNTASLST